MLDFIENIDHQIFFFINGNHTPFLDRIMMAVSGVWIWLPLYALVLIFILRKYGKKSGIIIIAFILLVPLTDQSANFIKKSVKRYRPSHHLQFENKIHLVNQYKGGQYGFVSSHASNVFGFITLFAFLMRENKFLIAALFVWASLVSYSRIYLGVHYPLDILGGAILGFLLAIVFWFGLNRTRMFRSIIINSGHVHSKLL